MKSFRSQTRNPDLPGYRLATAKILYRLPDYPALLQTFVWQQYDMAPEFPELKRFLTFWRENIEGELHSVLVGHTELLTGRRLGTADGMFNLH